MGAAKGKGSLTARFILLTLFGAATLPLAAAEPVNTPVATRPVDAALDEGKLSAGFRALESACFSCHSPNAVAENRIAPPMAAIKKHYAGATTAYADFRDQFVAFVADPSADNARMPGAVNKFGLMPKMSFDAATIEQIAYYVYHSALEAPGWFEQHYAQQQQAMQRESRQDRVSDADYLGDGKEVAMSAKAALGSNLKQAINAGGTVSAIDFCQANAIPITGHSAEQHDVLLKRVSDLPRNPANAASPLELEYIAASKAALAAGREPAPRLQDIDGRRVGYYPIVTNGMCLQCHGTPGQELQADTAAALKALYPEDQATGYGVNQLRGVFVVSMEKQ